MLVAVGVLALIILGLLVMIDRQQRVFQQQITGILERVQTPVLVEPAPVVPVAEDVPAVPYDDDEAFWKAREVTHGGS